MNQTEQFQLNQWDKSDRIQMEDFNADNLKTEQALAEQASTLAEHAATLANCGNCKIVYGSYTGTGTYGSENPNTLTFDHKPVVVFLQQETCPNTSLTYSLRLVHGSPWANGVEDDGRYSQTVSWGDTSVSWYSKSATADLQQFNKSNTVYHYVALLAADE